MTMDIIDARKAERYAVLIMLPGSYGAAEITIANISLAGVQVVHAHPLRIGSRARLAFHYRDLAIASPARVIWSRLSKNPDTSGKLLYISGLHLESPDSQFAAAIHSLLRLGAIRPDSESMDRKRARAQEREEARKALLKTL